MASSDSPARPCGPAAHSPHALWSLTFVLASCGGSTPDQVTLEWKLEPGAELVYEMTSRTSSEMPRGQGSTENTQIQIRRLLVQRVAPNGDATITVRSGDDPTTDQEMVVGRDGRLKSLDGLDRSASRPPPEPPPGMEAFASTMARMMSSERMMAMAQQNIPTLPTATLAPADAWRDSLLVPLTTGPVLAEFGLVLDALERRDGRTVARVSGSGDVPAEVAAGSMGAVFGALQPPPDNAAPNPFSAMVEMARMMDLDVDSAATALTFDVDRGIALLSTTSVSLTMRIPRAGPESMPMTIEHSVRLVEYLPAS